MGFLLGVVVGAVLAIIGATVAVMQERRARERALDLRADTHARAVVEKLRAERAEKALEDRERELADAYASLEMAALSTESGLDRPRADTAG